MKRLLSSTIACLSIFSAVSAQAAPIGPSASNLVQSKIKNGPWTLASGLAITGVATSTANPYSGYCLNNESVSPTLSVNTGINLMQPFYFPFTRKLGGYIQGFFDYRPRNEDEATVAAISADGGRTWNFNQKVQELTTDCPWTLTDANNNYVNVNGVQTSNVGAPNGYPYPSVATTYSNPSYADNGFGHPHVLTVNGKQFLYHLDRSDNNIDVVGLVVHQFTGTLARPLGNVPAIRDVPASTTGLLNPDAILGEFPGVNPGETTILYVQKQLSGDTSFPVAQQCTATPSFAASAGRAANHDVTTLRIATTADGVNFTDLGAVSGLNDSTTTSYHGIRYLGSGGVFPLADGRYGLVFGAGNCLDGDSDGFHFVGYAETTTAGDLFHWNVVNGLDNPIASTKTITDTTNHITYPANTPLLPSQTWFAGRAYGATVTYVSPTQVNVVFAGYNTPQPKNNLGDYRSIGRFDLTFPTNYVSPF